MEKIQHLFIVQSSLQFYLVRAYAKRENLSRETCLVMATRGSVLLKEKDGFTFIDGDKFAGTYSGLPTQAYRENRLKKLLLKEEVTNQLAFGFAIYAANFYQWWQQDLVRAAGKVAVLEDGMGSYHKEDFFREAFGGKNSPRLRRVKYWLKVTAAHGGRYADFQTQPLSIILAADQFLAVDAAAFPWVADHRKLVLKNVFPPQDADSLNGAWVLALSCLPEVGLAGLDQYLSIIASVVEEIPVTKEHPLYVKLHPLQANPTKREVNYPEWFEQKFSHRQFKFLGMESSLECLAVGSSLKLVTGVSSLAIYATAANREVYNYADRLVKEFPHIQRALSNLPAESRARFFGRSI